LVAENDKKEASQISGHWWRNKKEREANHDSRIEGNGGGGAYAK